MSARLNTVKKRNAKRTRQDRGRARISETAEMPPVRIGSEDKNDIEGGNVLCIRRMGHTVVGEGRNHAPSINKSVRERGRRQVSERTPLKRRAVDGNRRIGLWGEKNGLLQAVDRPGQLEKKRGVVKKRPAAQAD